MEALTLNPKAGAFEDVEYTPRHESLLAAFEESWRQVLATGSPLLLAGHISALRVALALADARDDIQAMLVRALVLGGEGGECR